MILLWAFMETCFLFQIPFPILTYQVNNKESQRPYFHEFCYGREHYFSKLN